MPWLGYFALINSVDTFVFLDDVQMSYRSWQRRNFIKGPDGAKRISISVLHAHRRKNLNQVKISNHTTLDGLMKTLLGCMGHTKNFDCIRDIFIKAFLNCNGRLSLLNEIIIKETCEVLNIKPRFINSSDLSVNQTNKGYRLLEICKLLNCDKYISPIGSMSYLKHENPFEKSHIKLRFLNFESPVYPQKFSPFIPDLSALDAIANLDPKEVKILIEKSTKRPLTFREAFEKFHEVL